MEEKIIIKGNSGPKVRSDCEVKISPLKDGSENEIVLDSKVDSMYRTPNLELINEVLGFYDVKGVLCEVHDRGALPFVIAARLEAACRVLTGSTAEYLPGMHPANNYSTEAARPRFSRLYLPGNTPSMMLNAGLHSPDGIILDLEDSVAPEKKDEARILVRNALRALNFYGVERMVRINQGKSGIGDLNYIVPHNVNLILVPKCESSLYIKELENEIREISSRYNIKNRIFLMPIIESALGIENAYEIATASENVVALAIGLEDYTADLGVQRTIEGSESLYARMRLVNAAKAARIQPIDSVFSDVDDMEALRSTVLKSKAMGFEGMGCIHPRQIEVIKKAFAPTEDEIEKAYRIVLAFKEAEKMGLGVVSLGSKMIDPPVVNRALKTIELALQFGLIEKYPDIEDEQSEKQ